MRKEALEAPSRIRAQLVANKERVDKLGERIREFSPSFVVTVGRGSSDHAAIFAKYLIEVEMGIQVSSSAPSVSSVFGKTINLERAVVIFISQSGRSPDILDQVKMAKKSGAFCIAIINDETSPIVDQVDAVLPIMAGSEKAVAATKSYLLTLSALLQLIASWGQDKELENAIENLPDIMDQAVLSPEQLNVENFQSLEHCIVIGRGFGYAISREIALKLKEVCSIHAEAFSSAEFLHGPVTLAEKELSILDILIKDESAFTHQNQVADIKNRGANILTMQQTNDDIHPRIAPLTVLQRFYLDVEKIALRRGINPDAPPGLKKVTKTV